MYEQVITQPAPALEANYQGNWILLQQERMQSADFQAKFTALMERQVASLKSGQPSVFEKSSDYGDHYAAQIEALLNNIDHVYSRVEYVAGGVGRAAVLGESTGLGGPGRVFSDTGLSDRHKDVIAAHEAAHGILKIDGSGVAKQEVMACFNLDTLQQLNDEAASPRPGYLRNADELLARMSQLKNYFGMRGGEEFTAEHLVYAAEHYLTDVGLDNSMSKFFAIIKPDTFVTGMNTLPV